MQSDVNVDGCQTWELRAKNYDSHSAFMCVEFFLGWALKGFTQAWVLSLSIRGDGQNRYFGLNYNSWTCLLLVTNFV